MNARVDYKLNFIQELLKSTIAGFSASTALALYAYFGLGLTSKTAMQIGTYAKFKGFFGYTIPLALASAIHESYITPMAKLAWLTRQITLWTKRLL